MRKSLLIVVLVLLGLVILTGCPKKEAPTKTGQIPPGPKYGQRYETPTATTTSEPGIFSDIRGDHKKISQILGDMEKTRDAREAQKQWTDLREVLVPHMKAEEMVFYPVVAQTPNGRATVDTLIEEHRQATQVFTQLKDMQPTDQNWATKVGGLRKAILTHVEREEGPIFQSLQRSMQPQQLDPLGDRFIQTKQTALDAMRKGGEAAGTSAKAGGAASKEMKKLEQEASGLAKEVRSKLEPNASNKQPQQSNK